MKRIANSWAAFAAALIVLMTLSGCQGYRDSSQRTPGEITDDVAILSEVKRRLVADPEISGFKVDVDVERGVVVLFGRVGSEVLKAKAVRLASSIKGVKKVEDQLVVVTE